MARPPVLNCSVTIVRHLVFCKFLLSCLGLLSSHAVRRGHHVCPWQVYVLIQVLHEREHFCSVPPCTNEILMPHWNHTIACARVTEHLSSKRRADLIQGRSESERCVEVSRALRSSALYRVHDQVPHLRELAKDAPVGKVRQISCTSFMPSYPLRCSPSWHGQNARFHEDLAGPGGRRRWCDEALQVLLLLIRM